MGIRMQVGHINRDVGEGELRRIQRRLRGDSPALDIADCPILEALISHVLTTSVTPTSEHRCAADGPAPGSAVGECMQKDEVDTVALLQVAAKNAALRNPIGAGWTLGDLSPESFRQAVEGIAAHAGPQLFAAVLLARHCAVDIVVAKSDVNGLTRLDIQALIRA